MILVDIVAQKGTSFKFALFLLFLFGIGWSENSESIAQQDRAILEPFFEKLLTKETLGYVLLGEKPIAFVSFIPNLSWRHPFRSLLCLKSYFSSGNQIAKKGWKTWEKYATRTSDQFLFVKETSPYSPLVVWVFIIKRDLFCQTIDENKDVFEKALTLKVNGNELFERAKQQPFFSGLLRKHEGLLGILLGYGKNNSRLFSEGKMDRLGFFPKQEDSLSPIALPPFRADWGDQETICLREKYLSCREKIRIIFLNQNLLDHTLKFLLSDETGIDSADQYRCNNRYQNFLDQWVSV